MGAETIRQQRRRYLWLVLGILIVPRLILLAWPDLQVMVTMVLLAKGAFIILTYWFARAVGLRLVWSAALAIATLLPFAVWVSIGLLWIKSKARERAIAEAAAYQRAA